MLLVGPILLFAAIGMTASAMNVGIVRDILAIEPLGELVYAFGRLVPYLLVIAAFTFIYMFIPNTRVEFAPALVGGIVGGVLWQSAGMAFALFVARSTQYSAIYSSFAILILFLIWLYLSWLILLFGASVAFYRQHPEYVVAEGGEPRLSNRMRERLALVIMSLIGGHYLAGRPAWTMRQLTQALGVPMHAVDVMLEALRTSEPAGREQRASAKLSSGARSRGDLGAATAGSRPLRRRGSLPQPRWTSRLRTSASDPGALGAGVERVDGEPDRQGPGCRSRSRTGAEFRGRLRGLGTGEDGGCPTSRVGTHRGVAEGAGVSA